MTSFQFPVWVEYTKALGAPIAALLAAFIASTIAYRQWLTAKNKLKLDLFDRRMKIYSDAVAVIRWMADADWKDRSLLAQLAESAAVARWILDVATSQYLEQLYRRANDLGQKKLRESKPLESENPFDEIYGMMSNYRNVFDKELRQLDAIFDPFLTIKH